MTYAPLQRGTLLIDYMGGPHLNVLLHKAVNDDLWLLAPITSVKPQRRTDYACILEADEHPNLTHQSYVAYIKMHEARGTHIARMVAKQVYFPKDAFSTDVFRRVVNGVFASEDVSTRRMAQLKRSGLSPS